jgi:L-lactate utilization protein LutC
VSARDEILSRINAATGPRIPHPGAFTSGLEASAWSDFTSLATRAGSVCEGPLEETAARGRIREWVSRWGGGRVVAQPGAAHWQPSDEIEIADPDATPHSFANVEVAIARAELAVAENGALAIAARDAPQRALLYLCQRLIVLVPARQTVPHMHAATALLKREIGAGPCFTWMAGPSKTADIEQELVVGAHGPRSLTIIGLE